MTLRIFVFSLLSFALGVASFAAATSATSFVTNDVSTISQEDRDADAAAIRAHIESIFQAFIDGDQEKMSGRGTEIFVRRGDNLVNVGWHLDGGQ